MVTKRARTWFARGTLVATLVVVGVLGGSTWVLSGVLIGDLLDRPADEETTEVIEVRHAEIVLGRTDRLAAPGRWAVVGESGFFDLGDIVGDDGRWVTRRILRADGTLLSGTTATVTRSTFGVDPRARGITYSEILLEGPEGDLPAWVMPGIDDTWIVYVPDGGLSRAESLRVAGVVTRLGLPMIVPGRPGEGDGVGRDDLGSQRWREVEAAIRYALTSGAAEVVIVGSGTGASAALITARESRFASRIVALVLDGALLDPGGVADHRLEQDQTPGFLVGWAKAAATFRRGIDWTALDHLRLAAGQTLPVLLIHGDGDDRFPVDVARRYAEESPDARLLVVPGAGHGEAWNRDPIGYERHLEQFLREVAVGTSGRDDYSG